MTSGKVVYQDNTRIVTKAELCRKHMKTMTAKDVKDADKKVRFSNNLNRVWAGIMSKR